MAKTLTLVLAVAALAACGPGAREAPPPAQDKDIGAQADVVSDTDALRAANAAAGDVVRAAGDCEAVKAALPEAQRRLDEIEPEVRTATGKATLAAVRKRVSDVAELCP
jgi:hypothetical protein